jgi:uncharacterized YigZ family protein
MEVQSYRTIQTATEGEYKEKGSKFLAFAFPVKSEADVKESLAMLRKKYFDARHHCYGYILGADKSTFRANDDGEPNHSAGDPILGQIRSKNLTNVLVVVVRYFGGTKLGVGGLVSAYKTAAEDALKHAIVIEKEVTRKLQIEYPYTSTPEVMKLVKDFELDITDQQFQEDCILVATVKLKLLHSFSEKFNLLIALGHAIKMQWL